MSKGTEPSEEKRHPIQVVARRSGLTADVLRVWEKRYGVVAPARSRGGRRLYSDSDVNRLRTLREAIGSGRRIGDVVGLSDEELRALVAEDRAETLETRPQAVSDGSAPTEVLEQAMAAVRDLDGDGLRELLTRAAVAREPIDLVESVIAPFMHAIGDRWEAGDITPAHEHLASAAVRETLARMMNDLRPSPEAPRLVVATPAEQRHEMGALLAAVTAALEHWAVTYLGADLPAADIASVARRTKANAVALSLALDHPSTGEEITRLRRQLDPNVPLLIGGRAAASVNGFAQDGSIVHLGDMPSLRAVLQALRVQSDS